jgi:uncharacterized membrane protein
MNLNLTDYHRLALAALWIGLMVTAGVFFAFIPNIEFVTVIAFLAGVIFGSGRGAIVAMTGEGLFSAMNPIGSGLAFPVLFILQVLAMGVMAMIGGWLRNWEPRPGSVVAHGVLGALGAVLTLQYDFLTALSLPLTAGVGESTLLATAVAGLPFFTVHILANTVLFAAFMPTIMRSTRYHLRLHGFMQPLSGAI